LKRQFSAAFDIKLLYPIGKKRIGILQNHFSIPKVIMQNIKNIEITMNGEIIQVTGEDFQYEIHASMILEIERRLKQMKIK